MAGRSVHLEQVEDLRQNLRPIMDRLTDEGKWRVVEDRTHGMVDCDEEGNMKNVTGNFMFVYRVLK